MQAISSALSLSLPSKYVQLKSGEDNDFRINSLSCCLKKIIRDAEVYVNIDSNYNNTATITRLMFMIGINRFFFLGVTNQCVLTILAN